MCLANLGVREEKFIQGISKEVKWEIKATLGIQNRKLRAGGRGLDFLLDLASILCSLPGLCCLFGYYLQGTRQPPICSAASPFNSVPFSFDSHSASKLSFPGSYESTGNPLQNHMVTGLCITQGLAALELGAHPALIS